ncbi:MAG: hypothetical protein QOJ71_2504 [Actinomycetota bacterium]|nr:hypothetical protein [Actinomycetota bacterium]
MFSLGLTAMSAIFLAVSWASTPTASAAPIQPGGVRIVHGLRGVVADVYFDGKLLLQTFRPERNTSVLSVPAGTHQVDVRLAGQPSTSPAALSSKLKVIAGQNESAVVHLAPNGKPELSVYPDPASAVPGGQARVIVRHTADAPPIDVHVDATRVATALANPAQAATQVKAGTYRVSVTKTGTPQELAPAQAVAFAPGSTTDMYLIGSESKSTLAWIAVQTVTAGRPLAQVQTGDSGLAAPRTRNDALVRNLAVLLPLCSLAAVAGALSRRRRTASGPRSTDARS